MSKHKKTEEIEETKKTKRTSKINWSSVDAIVTIIISSTGLGVAIVILLLALRGK